MEGRGSSYLTHIGVEDVVVREKVERICEVLRKIIDMIELFHLFGDSISHRGHERVIDLKHLLRRRHHHRHESSEISMSCLLIRNLMIDVNNNILVLGSVIDCSRKIHFPFLSIKRH